MSMVAMMINKLMLPSLKSNAQEAPPSSSDYLGVAFGIKIELFRESNTLTRVWVSVQNGSRGKVMRVSVDSFRGTAAFV